jgi:hypothetical protein
VRLTQGGVRFSQPKSPKNYLKAMGSIIRSATSGQNDGRFLVKDGSYIDKLPEGIDSAILMPYMETISKCPHEYVLCSLIHPTTSSCTEGMMILFYGEWWRALKMYAPLNAVQFD